MEAKTNFNKVKQILFQALFYLFPVFASVKPLFVKRQRKFIFEYWIFYIIGFVLLVYTHVNYFNAKDKDKFVWKMYFVQTYFFIMYISSEIDKFRIWQGDGGILNLNATISTCIFFLVAAYVIYVFIFSNLHISISQISLGNAKISLLKEKYNEEINNQVKNVKYLLEKFNIENKMLSKMSEYCVKVKDKLIRDGFILKDIEYQILLTEYFSNLNEKVKVFVLPNLDNNILKEFKLKSREIDIIKYQLNHWELYSTQIDNNYYLFIPFCYKLELINDGKPVYILLESHNPIIVGAEKNIICNLLTKFTDDLLDVLQNN